MFKFMTLWSRGNEDWKCWKEQVVLGYKDLEYNDFEEEEDSNKSQKIKLKTWQWREVTGYIIHVGLKFSNLIVPDN